MQGKQVDSRRGGVTGGLQAFSCPFWRDAGAQTQTTRWRMPQEIKLFWKVNTMFSAKEYQVTAWWSGSQVVSQLMNCNNRVIKEHTGSKREDTRTDACPAHARVIRQCLTLREWQFTFLLVYNFFVLWLCENYVIFIQFGIHACTY